MIREKLVLPIDTLSVCKMSLAREHINRIRSLGLPDSETELMIRIYSMGCPVGLSEDRQTIKWETRGDGVIAKWHKKVGDKTAYMIVDGATEAFIKKVFA
jgi:hypothetical protein